MKTDDLKGRRATVVGLGRHGGGSAVVRFLAERGAIVTATDLASAGDLAESLESLGDLAGVRYRLGGHVDDDFRGAELVVVNPAVRPGNRFVELARQAGTKITTEIDLFLAECSSAVVAVTGTTGKSTTATMIADMLRVRGRRVQLGGNIGRSLLGELPQLGRDDWVVLELSSFQLARIERPARRIELAVATNCTTNHLDWHAARDHYVAAKRRLFFGDAAARRCVLGPGDETLDEWRRELLESSNATTNVATPVPLVGLASLPPLHAPGEHNRRNALCAATAAEAIGCSPASIQTALAEFVSLPHRIEKIATHGDIAFYDDSKATSPDAAIAAIRSIGGNVWLLAGGYDAGADFEPMTRAIVEQTCGAALFGAAASRIAEAVQSVDPTFQVARVETLADALGWSLARAKNGDVVLLSPGCSSFDQFRDYAERGRRFAELVAQTAGGATPSRSERETNASQLP